MADWADGEWNIASCHPFSLQVTSSDFVKVTGWIQGSAVHNPHVIPVSDDLILLNRWHAVCRYSYSATCLPTGTVHDFQSAPPCLILTNSKNLFLCLMVCGFWQKFIFLRYISDIYHRSSNMILKTFFHEHPDSLGEHLQSLFMIDTFIGCGLKFWYVVCLFDIFVCWWRSSVCSYIYIDYSKIVRVVKFKTGADLKQVDRWMNVLPASVYSLICCTQTWEYS